MAVKMYLQKIIPKSRLYHGTSEKNKQSIDKFGLISKDMPENVYLTSDIDVEERFSKRHDKRIIYEVDWQTMIDGSFMFYQHPAFEHTILTDLVPSKYLSIKVISADADISRRILV